MNKAAPSKLNTVSTSTYPMVPRIEGRIQVIRGLRVIIDADLAQLYGCPQRR